MEWFYGRTGYSALDYWTLSHLAFWFVAGSTLAACKVHRVRSYLVCLVIALGWEAFEKVAEKQWPHIWLSPESWQNSWVSDILTTSMVLLAFWGFDRWRN